MLGLNTFGINTRDQRVQRQALARGDREEQFPKQWFEADRGLMTGDLNRAFDGRMINFSHPSPDQYMCWPPLIDIVDPVTKPPSSEARKLTPRAISLAWPRRPTGIFATIFSSTFSGTAATMSVSV